MDHLFFYKKNNLFDVEKSLIVIYKRAEKTFLFSCFCVFSQDITKQSKL